MILGIKKHVNYLLFINFKNLQKNIYIYKLSAMYDNSDWSPRDLPYDIYMIKNCSQFLDISRTNYLGTAVAEW